MINISHTGAQKLWGMTSQGGGNNLGVIFEYDAGTNTYTVKHDFAPQGGYSPHGRLLRASDGNLYGMTNFGGKNYKGVIFQFIISSGTYKVLYDFDDANGIRPFGSLIQAGDGNIYGMTGFGGSTNAGVIFQYNLTTGTYTKKIDFDTYNGQCPNGSLFRASDGNLFGLTHDYDGIVILFKYDISTGAYTKQINFSGQNGAYPFGSLMEASDGLIYGMTSLGGTNDKGVIFKYNLNTNTFTKLIDFIGQNGSNPNGSLFQGSDGNLYGMTSTGGTNNNGVLFQFNPVSSSITSEISFTGKTGDALGNSPLGSLMQASDGKLYGMAKNGGENIDNGVIFQYTPGDSKLTAKVSFTGSAGSYPGAYPLCDGLIEVPNNTCKGATFTQQPVSPNALCSPASATFTVAASGDGEISYKWQVNNGGWSDISNGGSNPSFSGATTSNLKVIEATATMQYRCIATNCTGTNTVTSNTIILTVNASASVNIFPASPSQCSGTSITFTSNTTGSSPYSYYWCKNGSPIRFETNSKYTINDISPGDNASYYCVVTNSCGSSTSNSSEFTVNTPPLITFITPDKIKCTRDSVLFKIAISNQQPAISYQWSKAGSEITGATKSAFIISVLTPPDAATYSCYVSNICGNTSASATLSVNTAPFIHDTIPNQIKCEGENVSFKVSASGNELKYQWTKGGSNIAGATNSTFNIQHLTLSDGDIYSCVVKNNCDSKSLKPFLLLINKKPVINIMPVTLNKNVGDSLTFSLSPVGTPPFTYQWQKNNINIPGATNNNFKIKPITQDDAAYYSCNITNDCGTINTQVGRLVINTGTGYTVSGNITYDNKAQTPITNTTVYLEPTEGVKLDSALTDNSGAYTFYNINNGSYKLICKTTKAWAGGNPLDALIINRKFIGTYTFTDPLKAKAADVNLDKNINPVDALAVNRRFIALITHFIAPDWLFDDPAISVNGGNIMQDIKAICAGDANGTYPNKK